MIGMGIRRCAHTGSKVVAEIMLNGPWKETRKICRGGTGDAWQ